MLELQRLQLLQRLQRYMNQILAIRPGTVDNAQILELKKQGIIIIECADPRNDIRVINTYGDIPPDSLLACALDALSYGGSDTSRIRFANLIIKAAASKQS